MADRIGAGEEQVTDVDDPIALTRRQMLGLIGAAAGAAVLVGCGGGGNGPTPNPNPIGPYPSTPGAGSPQPPRTGKGVVLGASRTYAQKLRLATHQYVNWDSDIFDASNDKTFLLDTTAFLNIKFAPSTGWEKGQHALWDVIASGAQDARIDQWIGILNRIPRKLTIALHHEPLPDDDRGPHEGEASDLVAATRRVVSRWRQGGVKHILTQCLFQAQLGGPAEVVGEMDAIGVDAYADSTRPTADQLFRPVLRDAQMQGKPIVIYETAFRDAVQGDGQQQRYYDSLDALLKQEKSIIGCALWLASTSVHNDNLNDEGWAVVRRMASDRFYTRQF